MCEADRFIFRRILTCHCVAHASWYRRIRRTVNALEALEIDSHALVVVIAVSLATIARTLTAALLFAKSKLVVIVCFAVWRRGRSRRDRC